MDCTGLEVDTPNSLRELTQASGANIGGESLNDIFVERLRHVFGSETIEEIKRDLPQAWCLLMQRFEQAKIAVKADGKKGMRVDVGYDFFERIRDQKDEVNSKSNEHGFKLNNGILIISQVFRK